jgi:outer membrane protein assembly factor BamA
MIGQNTIRGQISRIGCCIFALALVSVFGGICRAQDQVTLRRVEFVGLKRLTGPQVLELSGLKVGDTIKREAIDGVAQKLMDSGLFKKLGYRLSVKNDEAILTFEVEEAMRNLPVVFENFVWFSEQEIARAIRQDVPFFDGTAPEAGATAEKIAAALRRLLSQKNINGQVEFLPYVDTTAGKVELLFTVKGVTIPVCSVQFPGASAIAETDLIKAAQPLLKADYSRKNVSGFALYTLFPLYRRIGYLRAEFQQPTATIESSASCAGGVAVTIPVDEGIAYTWGKAEWSGNQVLTSDDLSTALGMKAGDLAEGPKIDKGIKEIRKAYGRRGYIAVRLKESSTFDDATKQVSYRFEITEGPRYFMGALIVNGLSSEDAQNLKTKWTLGNNAVFDESYIDDFTHNALRDFVRSLAQKSGGNSRPNVEIETKPDHQKQTVDVVITFK